MSSPETERFEVTENELEFATNPFASRRKQSKQKALYGVWADSSGSEGEEHSGFGFARSKKARKNAGPVSFQSAGIFQAGSSDKDKDKDKKDAKGEREADAKGNASDEESGASSDSEPSAAMRKSMEYTKPKSSFRQSSLQPVAAKGTRFGEWEKHTAGIGTKLLIQMGYEPGKGLGKHGQGIVNPIEAMKRTGREAVGYFGSERQDQDLYAKDRQRNLIDRFSSKDSFKKRDDNQDSKAQDAEARKPKRVQTAKELLKRTKANNVPLGTQPAVSTYNELAKVKVIDFRGPEQRVYSDYGELARSGYSRNDETATSDSTDPLRRRNFDVRPLCANLNRLVQLTEREIILSSRQCDAQRDMLAALQNEYEEVDLRCESADKTERRLRELVRILDRFEAEMRTEQSSESTDDQDGNWSVDKCILYLETELATNRSADLLSSTELNEMVVALCHVLAKRIFNRVSWTPLLDPTRGICELQRLRRLIQQCSDPSKVAESDTSISLVWQHVVPAIGELVDNYNVRNPDALVSFLETWCRPCSLIAGDVALPTVAVDYVLMRIVLPRLTRELESWSPANSNDLAVHNWLFSWLPLLGDRLDTLLPVVRQKLGVYIQSSWRSTDLSLIEVLRNWQKLFPKGEMQAFLAKFVLPKLQSLLDTVVIDPGNQLLEPVSCFLAWALPEDEPLFAPSTLAHLLDRFFFRKWLTVLNVWLSSTSVDYDEVTRWYLGWKSVFPASWHQLPAVKDSFARALSLMNSAIQGNLPQPVPINNAPPPVNVNAYARNAELPPQLLPMQVPSAAQLASFRDLVDQRAQELGVVFAPLVGRTYEGKQLYRLGNVQMFVDRHVPFAFQQGRWTPVDLEELFRLAVARVASRW